MSAKRCGAGAGVPDVRGLSHAFVYQAIAD